MPSSRSKASTFGNKLLAFDLDTETTGGGGGEVIPRCSKWRRMEHGIPQHGQKRRKRDTCARGKGRIRQTVQRSERDKNDVALDEENVASFLGIHP